MQMNDLLGLYKWHHALTQKDMLRIRYYCKHNLLGSCWPIGEFAQSPNFQHGQETPVVPFEMLFVDEHVYSMQTNFNYSGSYPGGKSFFSRLWKVDIVLKLGLLKLADWHLTKSYSIETDWGRSSWWPRLLSLSESIITALKCTHQTAFLRSLNLTNATPCAFASIMHEKWAIIGPLCHSSHPLLHKMCHKGVVSLA